MLHNKKFLFLLLTFLLLTALLFQNSFAFSNVILKIGMKNSEVVQLQKDLKKLGFMSIKPTGYFGTITKSAVKKFQIKYGLQQDGIAGPKTLGKIDKLLGKQTPISRGNDIREIPARVSEVNTQWVSGLPQTPFNKGIGKYEGVVLHYTDNTSVKYDTAQTEANYVKKHWKKAFVHEFVDSEEIIQVANPNYTSWGAGKYANHRFIQIELCRADNKADFIKSFDMFCKRAAEYLYALKLGVSPAKANGTGTLWSHFDVTNYLGGTDHTDPIAYLAKWGVNWKDVINEVTNDYNILASKDTTVNK
jgi:peptidoglycan hydrolase-like protein with peptidoglycan-binding domain